mmetsp:Transcript_22403/g.36008  ORF Transcript_22403/g.36008 Transcript_22403/m.36008 type:complete len:139 (-) Transcript_22403:498-914(-)
MALTTSRFSIFTSPTFVTALLFTVSTTKGLPFSLWESSLMLTGVSNVVNRAAVVTTAACTKVAQPAELTWLPKHQCDLCNRTYTRFKAMTAHVKTAHQNATWPCSLCNKKFPYPTSLRLHINVHKVRNNVYVSYNLLP